MGRESSRPHAVVKMDNGEIELWQASCRGDREAVKEALAKGADVNWKNSRSKLRTCVHIAVSDGHEGVIEELLSHNPNLDTISQDGYTPLMIACEKESMVLVQLLLDHGANPDVKGTAGFTALHFATIHNHPLVVKLLLDKGANRNTFTENNFSPLISAAKSGSRKIVKLLIEWSGINGEMIDVSHSGPEGNTALHYASGNSHTDVIKLLVKDGNLDKLNQNGDTPLHLASIRGHVEAVSLLVKSGADWSIQNNVKQT